MTISVEKIRLWRGDVEDRPGTLATTVEQLAPNSAGLDVIMGYSYPGERRRAVIELFPVTGTTTASTAERAGLAATSKPTLLVQGDDRIGLSGGFYRAIADAGINIDFLVALTVEDRFSLVIGFATDAEADRAAELIKKMAGESPGAENAPN